MKRLVSVMASLRVGSALKTCFKSKPRSRLSAVTSSSSSSPSSSSSRTLTTSNSEMSTLLRPNVLSPAGTSSSSLLNHHHRLTSSSSFSTTSSAGKAENYYNPYDVAETPDEAAELEPPVRYYKDTRFDEPDYDMPKGQVLDLYAEHQPSDLFTSFEISRDPVEWSYVERLLAPAVVPPPPPHPSYPTASGWSPARPDSTLPWRVGRKKDHHYDIRVEGLWKTNSGAPGGFQVTTVAGIEGDIWSFHRDAKAYLMDRLPPPQKAWQKRRPQEIETSVDEWDSKVDFKGIFDEQLKDFLLSKGM